MKTNLILAFVLLIAIGMSAISMKTYADTTKSKKTGSSLGTSFRFNPMSLKGKYQTAPGTEAVVENDKYLDDLLAPRKSFADRMKQNQQRN